MSDSLGCLQNVITIKYKLTILSSVFKVKG